MIAIIERIANFVEKKISKDYPLLEARLPDGSRVNSTIPPASPKGPTMTIRKFRKKPFTITDMVKNNTMNSEVAAFLWLCVEGMKVSAKNMIIAGGTGSGKTTTMNALTVFIPQRERIVTIEDTLELNLHGREDWVQLEARPGIYEVPLGMVELLKNTIRMRPDRILVGEVRGEEAENMFVAMDIGHQGVMSTVHSNSARETLLRLQSPPMNVPKSMFTLLDLIVMQHRMYVPNTGLIRRVAQIAEVSVMGEHVLLNDIYARDRVKDDVMRTDIPSQIVENFSFLTGLSKKEVHEELLSRQLVIDFLVDNNVVDYPDIQKLINAYYKNPGALLDKIESKKAT
jgi:flagellar protein FlaI